MVTFLVVLLMVFTFVVYSYGVDKDQDNAQLEEVSHSKNRHGKNFNTQSGTYTMKTYHKTNEQLFSQ